MVTNPPHRNNSASVAISDSVPSIVITIPLTKQTVAPANIAIKNVNQDNWKLSNKWANIQLDKATGERNERSISHATATNVIPRAIISGGGTVAKNSYKYGNLKLP